MRLKMDKLQKILALSLGALLAMAILLVCATFYWLFLDTPVPIEITSPLPVDKEIYMPGDTMIVTTEICRYTDATVQITATLVRDDGLRRPLPAQTFRGFDEGCTRNHVELDIPNDLQAGRWRRETRGIYAVNWLSSRQAEWYTEWFLVSGAEDG